MRVAYLLTWQHGPTSGVFAKVADQVTAWERQGVEVGIFVGTSPQFADDWGAVPQVAAIVSFSGAIESFRAQSSLLERVRQWRPDITYVRSSPRQASAARQLHRLPHVIEIQSDDLAEARMASLPRRALTLSTRRACLRGASGMVFVSRELAASPSYAFTTSNRVVIGNGIDLDRAGTLAAAPLDEPVRLVFMGHRGAPWHGVDEVYALAVARPEWGIDIIGPTAVDGVQAPANVIHHGELRPADYLPILARATVGLGTLALFTKGMHEASPLKSREYLARGLPVIGAYEDTDIPAGSPVYLRLPNERGAIVDHLGDVEAFIASWRGRRVQHSEIDYLDTSVKEAQRLEFLRQCIDHPR